MRAAVTNKPAPDGVECAHVLPALLVNDYYRAGHYTPGQTAASGAAPKETANRLHQIVTLVYWSA
jgi:hypothetical protein